MLNTLYIPDKKIMFKISIPIMLLLCAAFGQCFGSKTPTSFPADSQSMRVFNISLDRPPQQRWNEVAHYYKPQLGILLDITRQLFPGWGLADLEALARRNLSQLMKPEYADEIRGFAAAADVPIGDIVIFNFIYEFFAYKMCTTVIAQNTKNQVFMVRNLDYMWAAPLRNVFFLANFVRGTSVQFTAVTAPGYVGTFNGQKSGAYAVDINQRDIGRAWDNLWAMLFLDNPTPVGLAIREVLENPRMSFDQAAHYLQTVNLIAPAYYMIAGVSPGQGMVITRNRNSSENVWQINPKNGRWYIAQTNYDHWEPDPKDDARRTYENQALEKMGQNFRPMDLMHALSFYPVLNRGTIMTSIMSANQPSLMLTYTRTRNPGGATLPPPPSSKSISMLQKEKNGVFVFVSAYLLYVFCSS